MDHAKKYKLQSYNMIISIVIKQNLLEYGAFTQFDQVLLQAWVETCRNSAVIKLKLLNFFFNLVIT